MKLVAQSPSPPSRYRGGCRASLGTLHGPQTFNIGHVVQAVVGGRIRRESYPYKMGTMLVRAITRDAGVKGLIRTPPLQQQCEQRASFPYYGRRIALFSTRAETAFLRMLTY